MSKSDKLKDGNYIDSTGIVHGKKNLSDILDSALYTKGALDYTKNWNDLIVPGTYIYNGWSGEDTGSNRPTDERGMGFVIVLHNSTWGNRQQIYISTTGIYVRLFYQNTTWGSWRHVSIS